MAQGDKNLPVDLVVVEATKIEGEHVAVGTVLKKVDTEFAFELGAAGKVRSWSKELEADMKARAKAEAAAAEQSATATAPANGGLSANDLAKIIEAATAKGIETGIKLALESAPAADKTQASAE